MNVKRSRTDGQRSVRRVRERAPTPTMAPLQCYDVRTEGDVQPPPRAYHKSHTLAHTVVRPPAVRRLHGKYNRPAFRASLSAGAEVIAAFGADLASGAAACWVAARQRAADSHARQHEDPIGNEPSPVEEVWRARDQIAGV